MPKPYATPPDEAPLYIRWNPDRSAYAIEFKLELVQKIAQELRQAEASGSEIGGVLFGSLPTQNAPTIRIDEAELIPRSSSAGTVYMLDPGQLERFSEIRWRTKRSKPAVGFFRSHARSGALKPSLADQSLLSMEFKQGLYVLLLIRASEPFTAAFFVSANSRLPQTSAVPEFRFDERDFAALPEVSAETAAAARDRGRAQKRFPFAPRSALVVLAVVAMVGLFMFWLLGARNKGPWFGQPSDLRVAVTGSSRILRITWNHSAQNLDHASGATLMIQDGPSNREVKLGLDELRLGSVDYERSTPNVNVTLTLDTPGGLGESGSAAWTQQ